MELSIESALPHVHDKDNIGLLFRLPGGEAFSVIMTPALAATVAAGLRRLLPPVE